MRAFVELENGLLPDRFGKFAPEEYVLEGHPNRSFPIQIEDVPAQAQSLALAFVDHDSIPVCGFSWIHWLACDIAPDTTLIPENASAAESIPMVQGANSDFSKFLGGCDNKLVYQRYAGPYPPDKLHVYTLVVFALDCKLGLQEGYYFNEFRKAIMGHVLDSARVELPSRAE